MNIFTITGLSVKNSSVLIFVGHFGKISSLLTDEFLTYKVIRTQKTDINPGKEYGG